MPLVLAVLMCGGVGALSRYGVDSFIERRYASVFPWATFGINVSGSLLVGFLIAAVVDRHHAPQWLRTGLVVGFCGGYTTFSTFAQETLDLVEARDLAVACASVAASVCCGVLAVYLGAKLGRLV